ncbi:MAG: magnesium and cobalt transport protein CorA [Sphingomonadales bacterium]|nr:magnesium and cobalt transport protein CorA [Sphingomonadales bacterium]
MTTIAARLYHDGKAAQEIDLSKPIPHITRPNDFIWIGLHEPDDIALKRVQDHFGLHPLAVEDALDPKHLPKVDVYGDHLFLVIRTLITVRHGSERSHSPVRDQLEATPWLLRQGADYVLHAILDFIVDGYGDLVDVMEEKVLVMEERAIDNFLRSAETSRIFMLRRELFRLQRILGPTEDLASRFINLELPQVDANIYPYMRDLLDHIRRLVYRVEGLRDTLTSVIETSGLLEQQRQGAITRQLAAWAAILAVPTAIAGIYGMNFAHMPELNWEYGYFLIVGVMASICLTLYVKFKRSGWL